MQDKKTQLTKAMRWKIADWLAEERLDKVNVLCEHVSYKETFYSKYLKRAIDILISLIALLLVLPVNLVIGIITFFDVGSPIFFMQERIGRNGRAFKIVKFRNMKETRDKNGELLPPDQRVTKWGKFVRRTSLDELLNFYSVLKGDMSLIGPRPLPPEYLHRYNVRHKMRLAVRPGLECPPKNRLDHVRTWQERFENDLWYVEHVSFITDCRVLIRLVQFALNRNNTHARAESTGGTFMGYDDNGVAIDLDHVPEEFIDRALSEIEIGQVPMLTDFEGLRQHVDEHHQEYFPLF